MAVPKKRMTSTRSGKRRAHQALERQNLTKCTKCLEPVVPHQVCSVCGTYKGIQVIDFEKRDKKEKEIAKKKN